MKKSVLIALMIFAVGTAQAGKKELTGRDPNVLTKIDFAPVLGTQLPLDATFRDESGKMVKLGRFFSERPVVLVPVYYGCPMLCSLSLNGLLRAARSLRMTAGEDYEIVGFSINPRETAALALAKRENYVTGYNRANKNGWHFLTATPDVIKQITEAMNFQYVYDPKSDQYAHASGLIVATPDGRISRVLYGPEFSARDLKLSLVDSGKGRIGGFTEKVLLFCYAFDGANGRYTMRVMRVVQLAGAATVALLFTGIGVAVRRERKGAAPESHGDLS